VDVAVKTFKKEQERDYVTEVKALERIDTRAGKQGMMCVLHCDGVCVENLLLFTNG
jgi:hypothetical protein